MAAAKKKKTGGNTGSANAAEKKAAVKKATVNRVTSNIPSVYKAGNAVSLSVPAGSRGVLTEPTKIVRMGPFKSSPLVTQVKSGAPASKNMPASKKKKKK
jgi:hypothetical protein